MPPAAGAEAREGRATPETVPGPFCYFRNALASDEPDHSRYRSVISAAHDPLMNLIANTVHVLLTDRGIRADVAGARTRIDEAIDTVLWCSPPITLLPGRYAARDMEVAGARVREGDCLIIGYGPAHADPQVAPDIDTAALSGSRAHLAFGAGAHQCPAHNLARRIGIDAVAALLHHMPDLRLAVAAEDLVRRRSPFAHGLHALPAACTPTQRDADSSPLFPSAGGAPCPHAPTPSSWSPDRPTPRHASSTRPARWRAWWSRIFRFGH